MPMICDWSTLSILPPSNLAGEFEEKRIYGNTNSSDIIDIEQCVGVPIDISLIDDSVGKVGFLRRVIR